MQIIGLSGKSGSGKDHVANIMANLWDYHLLPLSLPVKLDAIAKYGCTYAEVFDDKPTEIRNLLQQIGTEDGRDVFGEEVWIYYTLSMAKWMSQNWGIQKFVIPDIRFQNELKFLTQLGYPVFRIVSDKVLQDMYGLTGASADHVSETQLDKIPASYFTGVFYNEYDKLDELTLQIETALTSLTWGE